MKTLQNYMTEERLQRIADQWEKPQEKRFP